MKYNEKGFNLFTALVSFLLIMLAVLLIQSMIQTERNATDTIAKIESRNRLEATAEMARADALQVFNYGLRKRIEDWLTRPDTGGLTLNLQDQTWKEIQDEFAASKFGGDQASPFAKFTASSLEGIFYSPSHFGNYTISLEGSASFEEIIETTIERSLDDFFTVIGCDDGNPKTCDKGTFYVNLHIERLTQEEYEKLPKLHVIDRATGEELKEIVLPRTTFRIYIPLRFFKAIAEAKALTHFPLGHDNGPQDQGLFSPRIHNEIEQMALGMCDYGSCAPRTNPLRKQPFNSSLSDIGNKLKVPYQFCPGDTINNIPDSGKPLTIGLERGQEQWYSDPVFPEQYNANNNDDWVNMQNALSAIGTARVCQVIKEAKRRNLIDAIPGDNFTLVGNQCEEGGVPLAFDIDVDVDALNSKRIGPAQFDSAGKAQLPDPGRNLGLYFNPDKDGEGNGGVDFPHIRDADLACSNPGQDAWSRCAEVKSVKVTLAFEEHDTDYMVRETEQGERRIYKISVYDNTYVPFTANWNQGAIGGSSLYPGPPVKTDCSMEAGMGWHCVSKFQVGQLGHGPQTVGCTPG
jgi:hypothetical protein